MYDKVSLDVYADYKLQLSLKIRLPMAYKWNEAQDLQLGTMYVSLVVNVYCTVSLFQMNKVKFKVKVFICLHTLNVQLKFVLCKSILHCRWGKLWSSGCYRSVHGDF